MKWTDELIKKVEKFIELKNKGFYCDSVELQKVYNEVLGKQVAPSNCGSCNRQRITELENALNQFKASEAKKAQELNNIKAEPKEEPTEAGNAPKPKRKKK